MHIWQQPEWPHFIWQDFRLLEKVSATRLRQGRLLGSVARLGFETRARLQAAALTEEALRSGEIDGELGDRDRLRAAVSRRLGGTVIDTASSGPGDEGIVEVLLDATQNQALPLGAGRLFGWQAALAPRGSSRPASHSGATWAWRDDAVAPAGAYRPPPARQLDAEMRRFLDWFERRHEPEGLVRAGLAHLWFAILQPFESGNGLVARAIGEMALAQSEASRERFYSLSSQIWTERADYVDQLERARNGGLDVTEWLLWFIGCLGRALDGALASGAPDLHRTEFWQRHAGQPFSDRQKAVLDRYLGDLQSRPTARHWAALAQCSIPTAQRDINDLVARNVLRRNPGGSKNTSYSLAAG